MNKKFFFTVIFIFCSITFFAEKFRISDVEYNINGQTREYALQKKVKIDKNRVFPSKETFDKYINDLKSQMENSRVFESVEIVLEYQSNNNISATSNLQDNQSSDSNKNQYEEVENFTSDDSETECTDIKLIVNTTDSMHLIVIPYPKYDSNNGFSLRLKAKDTNFLGSMEEMSGDFNYQMKQDTNDNHTDHIFGFNFDFSIPFKINKFNAENKNSVDINYTIGESAPEWKLSSGLNLELPFDKFSINFDFSQGFIRELDYEKYDDEIYFSEEFKFSVPITIQQIDNWGKIIYEPYISGVYNWDNDGIMEKNNDLISPEISINQKLSTERINWIENFRSGLSVSITNSYGYNFGKDNFIPKISGELKIFKSFKYFGFCSNIYAFAYMNKTENIGSRLRGIRDDVYFNKNYDNGKHAEEKACETQAAFIFSLDIPIRIFKVYWEDVPLIKKIGFAKYFNMEMQFSPFIDIAFINNRATNTDFYYKDAFYAGGLEVLVYPLKWKGIQIRASLGIDLGRKMPYLKGKVNQEWRKSASAYEISIGIGLQY